MNFEANISLYFKVPLTKGDRLFWGGAIPFQGHFVNGFGLLGRSIGCKW
ncbi:MAG: hypothetical protein NT070_07130 [Cyanobacteria bacterium]|nr:hypothetical protein [Cyanobacteriota bacterium]